MTHQQVPEHCPSCNVELQGTDSGMSCQACGAHFNRDRSGAIVGFHFPRAKAGAEAVLGFIRSLAVGFLLLASLIFLLLSIIGGGLAAVAAALVCIGSAIALGLGGSRWLTILGALVAACSFAALAIVYSAVGTAIFSK